MLFLGWDEPAGLEIDSFARRDMNKGRCGKQLARLPVNHVDVTGSSYMHQDSPRLAIDREIKQQAFVNAIVVEEIVRARLVEPCGRTIFGMARKDAARPFIIARTDVRIPRTGISGAVIDQVQIRVVRNPPPNCAPADL